jgi:5-methylcytosine-specific restriction protein A
LDAQSSGISIRKEIVDEFETLWFDFLATAKIRHNPFLNNDDYETRYTEGVPNQVTLTVYERNPHARKACLKHYGYSCKVCDFNFETTYGGIGKDFIHVHHLKHIATIDLRPFAQTIMQCFIGRRKGFQLNF